jgi:DNA helicase-2/ATP-dependent DNA helicase PcrA
MRSLDDPSQMEEERRICYVGMTRAKERLYLLHAASRVQHGMSRRAARSRFLDDVPEAELQRPEGATATSGLTARERRAALAARQPEQSDEPHEPVFAPGDRVVHDHFGTGVVVSCELVPGDQQVTVAFEGRGVKKLMLSFAPLAAATPPEAGETGEATENDPPPFD